jgi:hypothetical protein
MKQNESNHMIHNSLMFFTNLVFISYCILMMQNTLLLIRMMSNYRISYSHLLFLKKLLKSY